MQHDPDEPAANPHAALECVVARPGGRAANVDEVTLRLRGELTITTSSLVAVLIDEQLLDGRRVIRLDMADVAYIDCSSVGRLVSYHAGCLALGARLVIREPSAAVAHVLALTPHPLFVEPTPTKDRP